MCLKTLFCQSYVLNYFLRILKHLLISFSLILTLMKSDVFGLFWILIAFVLIFFILHFIEDKLVFGNHVPHNSRWCVALPSSFNLPYEEIYIKTTDNESLHSYFILQDKDIRKQVPTVVFCHGNAGNIGQRIMNCGGLYKHCQVNILIFDYRGYGFSTGASSEPGFYRDIEAVMVYLSSREDISVNQLVLFGRSLGGAVAIEAACRSAVNGGGVAAAALILENTFTSISSLAGHMFKFAGCLRPVWPWLLHSKFDSLSKIDRCCLPTLFISGEADTLVPPSMMTALYSACPPYHKTLHRVPHGDHNTTWVRPGYFESINSFLNGASLRSQPSTTETSDQDRSSPAAHTHVYMTPQPL